MTQSNFFSINYSHYIDKLESTIVQAIRAFSIEHKVSIDYAKIAVRKSIQNKINELLTDEEIKNIDKITDTVEKGIINNDKFSIKIYELLKTFYA